MKQQDQQEKREMYCRKCGNILDDGAVFCSVCGTPVKKRGDSEPGRHSADQMEDADQSTYWADGRKGNGVGEKFVYMSPFAQEIRTPLIYFIFIHISLYMPGQSLQYGMNMKPRI